MVGEVAGTRIVATPMTMRAISAAGIGNLLEWYDWSVYVVLARQIGAVFFPSDNPLKETLSAFLFYGVGFLMRPVGAIVNRPSRRQVRPQERPRLHGDGDGAWHLHDRLPAELCPDGLA